MTYRWLISGIVVFLVALVLMLQSSTQDRLLMGGCDDESSQYFPRYHQDDRVITYCDQGDANTDALVAAHLPSGSYVTFMYAGYPEQPDVELMFRDELGNEHPIVLDNAREAWRRVTLAIPNIGESVELVARDEATGSFGWIGIGQVRSGNYLAFFPWERAFVLLAILTLLHLILTTLFSQVIARSVNLIQDDQALVFILLLGMIGWMGFWLYYIHPVLGVMATSLLGMALLLHFIQIVRSRSWHGLRDAQEYLLPVSTLTLVIIVVGYFPFDSVTTLFAAQRWHDMPGDNQIPLVFAQQIMSGHVTTPMYGDWLSSDRPPLQTGLVLMIQALTEKTYAVVATWLQALVLIPCLLLLRAARWPVTWILVALSFSAVVAIHSLFVWPKLLSAVYQALFLLLLLDSSYRDRLPTRVWIIACGLAAALAALSHGAALFVLMSIGITWLLMDRTKPWQVASAALVAALTYLPWMLYQNLLDPPGNRLVKWHLAGIESVHSGPFLETILSQYQTFDRASWWLSRVQHWQALAGSGVDFFRDVVGLLSNKLTFRQFQWEAYINSFFQTVYAFWWLMPWLGMVGYTVLRIKKTETDWLTRLLVVCLISYLIWGLLIYTGGGTVIHQGSLLPWLLLAIFSAASLLSRWAVIGKTLIVANLLTWLLVMPGLNPLQPAKPYLILVVAAVGLHLIVIFKSYNIHRSVVGSSGLSSSLRNV